MTTCNIKKSQCFDLDYHEYENVINNYQANDIALQKEFSYFIFNNCVFIVGDRHSFYAPIKTGFWRIDLLNE